MRTIAGFAVLPVVCGPKDAPVTHYMYIRRHEPHGKQTFPAGRTLFIVNLPTDTSRAVIRDLFRKAGAVESIDFHNLADYSARDAEDEDGEIDEPAPASTEQPSRRGPPKVHPLPPLEPNELPFLGSGSNAHLVFVDESSLDRAMELPDRLIKPFRWPQPISAARAARVEEEDPKKPKKELQLMGLDYFIARHRHHRPPLSDVKKHADTSIERFAWIREHPQWLIDQRKKGDKSTGVGVGIQGVSVGPNGELLDEDGFVIVQRGGRYGRTGGGDESAYGSMAAATPEFEAYMRENPDAKKPKELEDFYRFQFREKKRQRACLLTRICRSPRPVRGGQGACGSSQGDAPLQALLRSLIICRWHSDTLVAIACWVSNYNTRSGAPHDR